MNENSGGVPTPTAQGPGVVPTPQAPIQAQPVQPVQPTPVATAPAATTTNPVVATAGVAPTTAAAPTATTPITQNPAPVAGAPAAPTTADALNELLSQPAPVVDEEPKDSIVEPKKKKSKVGLIVIIILLLVLVIGGAVAAILILKPFGKKQDAVPAAMAKLFANDRPQNIVVNGNISVASDDQSSIIKTLTVDFNSALNTKTSETTLNADVSATLTGSYGLQFNIGEVGTTNGDYYLRVSDLTYPAPEYEGGTSLLEGSETAPTETTDTVGLDTTYTYEDPTGGFFSILSLIEDKWVRVSSDTIEEIWSPTSISTDKTTQCLVDAAGRLGNYGSEFSTLYSNNSFITYSTDNLKVAKKKYDIYKLGFDAEALAGFINSLTTSGFVNEINACMGDTAVISGTKISADKLNELLTMLPEIYVEIDDDNNFSRVYLSGETNGTTTTADLNFSYPSEITITEPDDYIDISTFFVLSDQSVLNQGGIVFEQ